MKIVSDYDNRHINEIFDNDIVISDSEIQALANLSKKTNAYIKEHYDRGKYFMSIKFDDGEDQILLASNDKKRYKELVSNFLKKFIKFGGNIKLEDIFDA